MSVMTPTEGKMATTKKKSSDRHKSGFMVRFPADLRALFEEVKRVSGQPFTTAGCRAMEDYARRLGIEPGRK